MKRRDFSTGIGMSALALGLPGLSQAQGGPVEGRHYQRLSQALPTPPGKIDVVEFFWYACPHCYVFEPVLDAWRKQLPADVNFHRVHVLFRPNMRTHQRTFFALEAMGKETEVRAKIFEAIHRQGQYLDEQAAMSAFLAKQGIDAAKFNDTFASFGVDNKCRQADKLAEGYRIDGVPALGLGGRFLTAPSMAPGGQRVSEEQSCVMAIQVANTLLDKLRKGG